MKKWLAAALVLVLVLSVWGTATAAVSEDPAFTSEASAASEVASDTSEASAVTSEDASIVSEEPSAVSHEVVLGDPTGDGSVDMKDVLVIRKYIAGLSDSINVAAADVTGDGSVDMKDVLRIRKFIASLSTLDGIDLVTTTKRTTTTTKPTTTTTKRTTTTTKRTTTTTKRTTTTTKRTATTTKRTTTTTKRTTTTTKRTTAASGSIKTNDSFVFRRNEYATVSIVGKPNTKYTITVYYKSGASTAEGLEPKTSDANGNVSWTWKIGGRTSPGTYRLVIAGDGESIERQFTVITD